MHVLNQSKGGAFGFSALRFWLCLRSVGFGFFVVQSHLIFGFRPKYQRVSTVSVTNPMQLSVFFYLGSGFSSISSAPPLISNNRQTRKLCRLAFQVHILVQRHCRIFFFNESCGIWSATRVKLQLKTKIKKIASIQSPSQPILHAIKALIINRCERDYNHNRIFVREHHLFREANSYMFCPKRRLLRLLSFQYFSQHAQFRELDNITRIFSSFSWVIFTKFSNVDQSAALLRTKF